MFGLNGFNYRSCLIWFVCLFVCWLVGFVLGVLSQSPSGGLFDKNVRSNTITEQTLQPYNTTIKT